jgi:transposase
MTKTFRPYTLDQQLLLPPDLRAWLPEGDLALFISDVVDELDLSGIYAAYESGDGRGQPPYHPAMIVKLLLYAYCVGTPSSRQIERATYRDVAMRVLAGDQHPDHDSIAAFRQRHLDALAGLFVQVLRLCQTAGLVTLGHVALDGTKLKANASKHKAMSYARMGETERRLEAEVRTLLERAHQVDAAEDAQYGRGGGATSCRPSWPGGRVGWRRSGRRRPRSRRRPTRARRKRPRPGGRSEPRGSSAWARRRASRRRFRSGAGPAGADGAAELHRSGVADHGRWGHEGVRAGV